MAELVAKRYGTALYELAVEKDKVKELSSEINAVKEIWLREEELVSLMNHPKVVVEEKIKIIENILSGHIGDELLGLIVLTIKKGRQDDLIAIFNYCLKSFDDHQGILTAHILSADELSKDQKGKVVQRLENLTGKTVNTEYKVDKSLIGGLIIRIGDRIIDNSIKGKIDNMSKSLYIV